MKRDTNVLGANLMCFDYKMYTGSYQPFTHYYFCAKCFSKIARFMIDNDIHGDKVIKMNW